MKVLILCNDFPPKNTIGAQRPYSWYKHFPKDGVETVVVTKNIDPAFDGKIHDGYDQLRSIVYAKNDLHPSDRIIQKYGTNKFVLIRKLISFFIKILAFYIPLADHHRSIFKTAKQYLAKNKVDLIICTGEPFILFKYGSKLSAKYKIPWVADYRDGWYHNHVTSFDQRRSIQLIRNIEKGFEKRIIRTAFMLVTVDEFLADKLRIFHQKEVIAIYNGFDSIYQGNLPVADQRCLVLTYAGTLIPAQEVEFLLEAVSELLQEKKIAEGDLKIRFIGLADQPGQMWRINKWKDVLGPFISIEHKIPRKDAIDQMAASDILVSFTEKENKSIYAKNYDYISVHRPIWVIPTDHSILSKLVVEELKVGKSFADRAELKKELMRSVVLKKNGESIQNSDTDTSKLMFYSREKQAAILVQSLKAKLNSGSNAE